MPEFSSAARMTATVWGCGERFPSSKSVMVALDTLARSASASAVIPKPARAMRHCSGDMRVSLKAEYLPSAFQPAPDVFLGAFPNLTLAGPGEDNQTEAFTLRL